MDAFCRDFVFPTGNSGRDAWRHRRKKPARRAGSPSRRQFTSILVSTARGALPGGKSAVPSPREGQSCTGMSSSTQIESGGRIETSDVAPSRGWLPVVRRPTGTSGTAPSRRCLRAPCRGRRGGHAGGRLIAWRSGTSAQATFLASVQMRPDGRERSAERCQVRVILIQEPSALFDGGEGLEGIWDFGHGRTLPQIAWVATRSGHFSLPEIVTLAGNRLRLGLSHQSLFRLWEVVESRPPILTFRSPHPDAGSLQETCAHLTPW